VHVCGDIPFCVEEFFIISGLFKDDVCMCCLFKSSLSSGGQFKCPNEFVKASLSRSFLGCPCLLKMTTLGISDHGSNNTFLKGSLLSTLGMRPNSESCSSSTCPRMYSIWIYVPHVYANRGSLRELLVASVYIHLLGNPYSTTQLLPGSHVRTYVLYC
jgi:hypothetical protein